MIQTVFRRFMKRKVSVFAAVILLMIVCACVFGPMIVPIDPLEQNLTLKYTFPSKEHLLGTDNLGRDILARMLYGGRTSLMISFSGVIAGTIIGTALGVCAGFFGGKTDIVISRFLDILLAFPGLLLAIAVVAVLGNGLQNTIIAVAIFSVPGIARMVRGVVIGLRSSEYIQAARIMGESDVQIIYSHIIPNATSQIIVNMTLNLGTAILIASSLSFLGLGVQPPDPEWGSMLSQARDILRSYPLAALIPGIAITVVVMSFSLIGDGLRDALDPKLKNL